METVTAALLLVLVQMIKKGLAIDCFECVSLDGSDKDCEDEFGPYNRTGKLIRRDCRVGYLSFKAFHCVKIKGVKPTQQTIVIRTCSVEDWGTQCGSIQLEQGDENHKDPIKGCLSSCDLDGCNTALPTHTARTLLMPCLSLLIVLVIARPQMTVEMT